MCWCLVGITCHELIVDCSVALQYVCSCINRFAFSGRSPAMIRYGCSSLARTTCVTSYLNIEGLLVGGQVSPPVFQERINRVS